MDISDYVYGAVEGEDVALLGEDFDGFLEEGAELGLGDWLELGYFLKELLAVHCI